jgi:hypothetical protein
MWNGGSLEQVMPNVRTCSLKKFRRERVGEEAEKAERERGRGGEGRYDGRTFI